MSRAERSRVRKAAWARRTAQLAREFADAAPAGSRPEERRAARRRRQAARVQRDVAWRADIEAAGVSSARGPARPARRTTPLVRRVAGIEAATGAAWTSMRGPTRAQQSSARRAAWGRLQLERLAATSAARTSRRGGRRQARSQAWLAGQAARIETAAGLDRRLDRGMGAVGQSSALRDGGRA